MKNISFNKSSLSTKKRAASVAPSPYILSFTHFVFDKKERSYLVVSRIYHFYAYSCQYRFSLIDSRMASNQRDSVDKKMKPEGGEEEQREENGGGWMSLLAAGAAAVAAYGLYQWFMSEPSDCPIVVEGKLALDGAIWFTYRDSAYSKAKHDGGGREPVYHAPHKPGGSHHFKVGGNQLVNRFNMPKPSLRLTTKKSKHGRF